MKAVIGYFICYSTDDDILLLPLCLHFLFFPFVCFQRAQLSECGLSYTHTPVAVSRRDCSHTSKLLCFDRRIANTNNCMLDARMHDDWDDIPHTHTRTLNFVYSFIYLMQQWWLVRIFPTNKWYFPALHISTQRKKKPNVCAHVCVCVWVFMCLPVDFVHLLLQRQYCLGNLGSLLRSVCLR